MNRNDLRYKLRLLAAPFEAESAVAWEYVADLESETFMEDLAEFMQDYLYDMNEYSEDFCMTFRADLLTDKQVMDDY